MRVSVLLFLWLVACGLSFAQSGNGTVLRVRQRDVVDQVPLTVFGDGSSPKSPVVIKLEPIQVHRDSLMVDMAKKIEELEKRVESLERK